MRAWAKGLLCLEAAVELLIGHRQWLHRKDFLDVAVEPGWEAFGARVMAAVDFEAAAAALVAGVLPCSSGFSELKTIINIRCSRVAFRWHEGSR
jgi:hypothetical protein